METDKVYKFNDLNVNERNGFKSQRFFSQGNFYDPERIQFGTLRLLNSNYYTGEGKFSRQYHNDLEVVIIPLTGSIQYVDSKANNTTVDQNHFITISAGSGIEYAINSACPQEEVNYLKIWILPKKRGLTPKHQILSFDPEMLSNRFYYIVAPDKTYAYSASLYQDAWIALSQLDPKIKLIYHKKLPNNGVFIRVGKGEICVNGHILSEGDCIAFEDKNDLEIEGIRLSYFILLDIPMDVTLYDADDSIIIPSKL